MPNKDPTAPIYSDIQSLIQSLTNLELGFADKTSHSKNRKLLDQTYNQKYLDKKVKWIEKNQAEVLSTYAKIFRITYFSKQ